MKFTALLASTLLSASAVFAKKKVFIDNDQLTALNVLLPYLADIEVVGVSASFGDPTLVDSLGYAYDILKQFNLNECVPLYAGAAQPLLRNKNTFDVWETLFGEFVWKGAYDDSYTDVYNSSYAQYDQTTTAAMALINAVKQNPGEVTVYAAGLMTTVAQALSMYPTLAEEANGLWIMGGYIDNQYAQVTGGDVVDDINTDFNLMFDPEAAQIALTANWSQIMIGGNVTNYIYETQELFDELISKVGPLDRIENDPRLAGLSYFIGNGNLSSNPNADLPMWDEVVSGSFAFPELILNSTDIYIAVDTAFDSPFYGNIRIWPADLAPRNGVRVGKATYINKVDVQGYYGKVVDAFTKDWTQYCALGGPLDI